MNPRIALISGLLIALFSSCSSGGGEDTPTPPPPVVIEAPGKSPSQPLPTTLLART